MPETLIQCIISKKLDPDLVKKWLKSEKSEDVQGFSDSINCTKGEFVLNFLSYIRSQTESLLKNNIHASQILQNHQTPEKMLNMQKTLHSVDSKKHKRAKTKLFTESPDVNKEKLPVSSTPVNYKNNVTSISTPLSDSKETSSPLLNKINYSNKTSNYFETPKASRSSSRISSTEKSFSLADYMTTSSKINTKKKKNKNLSSDSTDDSSNSSKMNQSDFSNHEGPNVKEDFDISSSDAFPEIGTKKMQYKLKFVSEKRRIKPTNLSASASFSNKTFPLTRTNDNDFLNTKFEKKDLANSFEAERNILKLDRDKIIEKFAEKTPKFNIQSKKDLKENFLDFVEPRLSLTTFKNSINILVDIYNVIFDSNMLLCINSEIYFLMSIILSKQLSNEMEQILGEINNEKSSDFLLKSIHNSTYFAMQTLWHQRYYLQIILDKSSLKLLCEHKIVKEFSPELSRFLLNVFTYKAEFSLKKDVEVLENNFSEGNVCFNFETDNAENFPTSMSFQHFKKQRDLFYEILRWWTEDCDQMSFRSKVRSLLNLSISPANHKHLARLFTAHLLQECGSTQQESKLSKLQRRLISAPTNSNVETNRQPKFSGREIFYRDFIICSENEALRSHLKDIFAFNICQMDNEYQPNCEEINNESSQERRKDYYQTIKKLRLLSKFFGMMVAMPYNIAYGDYLQKTTSTIPTMQTYKELLPNEKVLENDILIRNHTQPLTDLMSIINISIRNGRLSITIPWLCQYLSMLDHSTLRTKYHKQLINLLFIIYMKISTKNAKILKLCLASLFETSQFPQEIFYSDQTIEKSMQNIEIYPINITSTEEILLDSLDLVDDSCLLELCPFIKELNGLVLNSNVNTSAKDYNSTFRHITPVTMPVDPIDKMKIKENELQAKLEQSLIKCQPSSTRRVLELVSDRVSSATVKYLTSHLLADYRRKGRTLAVKAVKEWKESRSRNQESLLKTLKNMYADNLTQLKRDAESYSVSSSRDRCVACVEALLPRAVCEPLAAVTAKTAVTRTRKWLVDNWHSTSIFCKDIEAEMRNLLVIGDSANLNQVTSITPVNEDRLLSDSFDNDNVSVADVVMSLKDAICVLLIDNKMADDLSVMLRSAAKCCQQQNVFITPQARKKILQLSVDLLIVYVRRYPELLTLELMNQFNEVWNECCSDRPRNINRPKSPPIPERRDLSPIPRDLEDDRADTPISSDDDNGSNCEKNLSEEPLFKTAVQPSQNIVEKDWQNEIALTTLTTEFQNCITVSNMKKSHPIEDCQRDKKIDKSDNWNEKSDENLTDYFTRILCVRNMMILGSGGRKNWENFAEILVFLLKNDYLLEDSLTEQCLAVFRQEWDEKILENFSICLKIVSEEWSRSGSDKDALFLDFLSEFCVNMDFVSDDSFL